MKGFFITFEGTEGSGKTTQIKRLQSQLMGVGIPVVVTREPGGTAIGEKIRRLLLSKADRAIAYRTELFLYLSSRAQHVLEVIHPSLKSGKVVLCDRFSDATLAYQVSGRGLPPSFVRKAIAFATQHLKPDLTFLLDLPVKEGLSRVSYRGSLNRMDREHLQFHQRVRNGYLRLARSEPRRIKLINAEDPIEEVAQSIHRLVRRRLSTRMHSGQSDRGRNLL